MIIIIVGAVIGFLGTLASGPGLAEALLIGAFSAALGFLAAMLIGIAAYSGTHWDHYAGSPLVSMADGAGIEGHFFLGSGSIDSSPSFTWYEKNGENSYVRRDVDASEATVHYVGAGESPHYDREIKRYNAPRFFMPWGVAINGDYGEEHYDFYIPKGSIVQSYKLDNQ